jgi:hypothetical protein
MWIGSKVPPRMPVRTTPRIGRGRGHQPEGTSDIRGPTPETGLGVDITASNPRGQVHPRHPVWASGEADNSAPGHPLSGADGSTRQIRDGDLEPGDRLDGHRVHPCHRSGEGDQSRDRSPNRGSRWDGVVDPPMPLIGPNRFVSSDHRTIDRCHETNCRKGQVDQHLPSQPDPNAARFSWTGGRPLVFRFEKRGIQ